MATSINYAIKNYNNLVNEKSINPMAKKIVSGLLLFAPIVSTAFFKLSFTDIGTLKMTFFYFIIFFIIFTLSEPNVFKKVSSELIIAKIDNIVIPLYYAFFIHKFDGLHLSFIEYFVVTFSLLVICLVICFINKTISYKENTVFNKIHYLIISFCLILSILVINYYESKYHLSTIKGLFNSNGFIIITVLIIFLYGLLFHIVYYADNERCFFTERTQDFNKLLSMFKRIYNVIFNKIVSLLNNAIKLLKEMHFMVIDLLKRKYISKGLVNFTLRDISDLYSIFGINLLNIKGFVDLDEANRNSFKIFIVNFYNALSLDSKPKIHPLSVNYVKEIEYYIKGPDDDILIVGKKLFKVVDNEEIILEDYIDKKYEKQEVFKDEPIYFLRFDYLFDNKKEWLHIKEDGITWY